MNGTLFIVATPIGNLKDITLRAIEILKSVDVIVCEDTRRTTILLNHYEIHKRLISCYDAIEEQKSDEILSILKNGNSVALVSDSGMPLISDPGFRVVRKAREAGIKIDVIPGPTAFVSALVLSGLRVDRFIFLGFIPKSKSKALKIFSEIRSFSGTIIIYESCHRLLKTIDFIEKELKVKKITLVRELTKLHQEVITDTISKIKTCLTGEKKRGEFVILFEFS